MDEKKLGQYLGIMLKPDNRCLSNEELYAFARGTLHMDARERVETHLLNCSDCLDRWRDFREFLQSQPATGRVVEHQVRRRVPMYLAMAASMVLVIGLALFMDHAYLLSTGPQSVANPQVAALVDLYPQTMALRGGPENQVILQTERPEFVSLVLNMDKPVSGMNTLVITDHIGRIIWEETLTVQTKPLCILLPTSGLTEGNYLIRLQSPANQDLETFEFKVVLEH
ncbi:zf-HC2 domain-containing protein [bacterium]|nr:zf-HC2 domain-containing protein [bacterium]